MKNTRWTLSAAALCMIALSAYGCSSSDDDLADDDDGTSSSSGGKTSSSGGKTSSSSSGGKTSSSSSGGKSSSSSGGQSSSSSGGESSSSSGGSSSSSGDAGASSSSSGDAGASSSGGNGACTSLTPGAWENIDDGAFQSTFAPNLPNTTRNEIDLEFYVPVAVGEYDLASDVNSTFADCEQCIRVLAGTNEAPTRAFFQSAGKLKVTAGTDTSLTATYTGLKFQEISLDDGTPLEDGECVSFPDGSINVAD